MEPKDWDMIRTWSHNPLRSEGSLVQEDLVLKPLKSHPEPWIGETHLSLASFLFAGWPWNKTSFFQKPVPWYWLLCMLGNETLLSNTRIVVKAGQGKSKGEESKWGDNLRGRRDSSRSHQGTLECNFYLDFFPIWSKGAGILECCPPQKDVQWEAIPSHFQPSALVGKTDPVTAWGALL